MLEMVVRLGPAGLLAGTFDLVAWYFYLRGLKHTPVEKLKSYAVRGLILRMLSAGLGGGFGAYIGWLL